MQLTRLFAVVVASIVGMSTPLAQPAQTEWVDYVLVPPQRRPDGYRERTTPDILYLNRCAQGCAVSTGGNSAALNQSTVPMQAGTLSPFSFGDSVWQQVVECVTASFYDYGVEVVTAEPSGPHVEVMVAGSPPELGFAGNVLGVAPLANDCSSQVDVIAFAFANIHMNNVLDICATAAHEAGHVYGLDHAFDCRDPMTYLVGCGRKHFANLNLECGEFTESRPCRCGDRQNSHLKLVSELGPGGAPAGQAQVSIEYPAANAVIGDREAVFVRIGPWRPMLRLELWINGTRWARRGATSDGVQQLPIPNGVPDGLIDAEVRAIDDLGTVSRGSVRFTKGAACGPQAPCSSGQCEQGRCIIPPGEGEIGTRCTSDGECADQLCVDDGRNQLCSLDCVVGVPSAGCPSGSTCLPFDAVSSEGACWPDNLDEDAGCCSTSGRSSLSGILLLACAALWRRRRHSPPR